MSILSRTRTVCVLALGGLPLVASAEDSKLLQRLATLGTQPDVVLVPPIGEPSPAAGSFLIPYVAEGEPDPRKLGTYGVGGSSCSDKLTWKLVKSAETRKEVWVVDAGVAANIGLPFFKLGGDFGHKGIAGLDYKVTEKLIVSGGHQPLEECCLRTPEACTDVYISEYWLGTGALHRAASSGGGLKSIVKGLEKNGLVDFSSSSGWNTASEWTEPMYFAYRTASFQQPSCECYMNNLPDDPKRVLFTGVSAREGSEQAARRDARDDARRQLVEYLGTEYQLVGDSAYTHAEALISGVKDSLTCLDDTVATAEGPRHLARVRMYVDRARVDAAMAELKGKTQ